MQILPPPRGVTAGAQLQSLLQQVELSPTGRPIAAGLPDLFLQEEGQEPGQREAFVDR
jgi:hypothetical protein